MTGRRSPADRPRRPAARATRRDVLAAGAALVGLAGCASVDLGGDADDREIDPARLDEVTAGGTPEPPDAFPVAVPSAMLDRHRERARALVSAVPERPDVPNGAVAERLRHDREHVLEALEDGDEEPTALERLGHGRYVRADAAAVAGTYRAATGSIDREAVADRRETLRADRRAFEAGWAYRGGDPAPALVVHAELESMHERARWGAEAWPPVPADPATDVFRVGEAVRNVEAGRAALADAGRLRARYLDGVDGPRSHRAAVAAAAHRLGDRLRWDHRFVHEYLDAPPGEPPFDRSVEDTPAAALYREARQRADGAFEPADRARDDGDHATAALRAATGLATLRAFEAVVEAIESGEYDRPADADRLAAAREAAVDALEAAWETPPAAVSAAVAERARGTLYFGHRALEDASGHPREVDRAYAQFAYARHYAEAVPAVVGTVVEALDGGR